VNFASELKLLQPKTRNKVRALLTATMSRAIPLMNNLRKSASARELTNVERVLRSYSMKYEATIPNLFPEKPQTRENYVRLIPLNLGKQLEMLNLLAFENLSKLEIFIEKLSLLNMTIINRSFADSDAIVGELIIEHGYSHLLLRKIALVKVANESGECTPNIDFSLEQSGLGGNNLIVSSLLQCYQEEQNFLSMKRSLMNLPDRGGYNKYTRDMTRIPFHPHASNDDDLSELIMSSLQSSLIDALVIAKVNRFFWSPEKYEYLYSVLDLLQDAAVSIDRLASQFLGYENGESIFYKRSSVWLENNEIINYRMFLDHFYDAPEAPYFVLDEPLVSRLSGWAKDLDLAELDSVSDLTNHNHKKLKSLEAKGLITRSALFNYLILRCEGEAQIPDDSLFSLMSRTSDLEKTINSKFLKYMANNAETKISKIVFYLLIARKDGNEADNFRLRRLIQDVVKDTHEGKLVNFVSELAEKSEDIAFFMYEVCTEDFIAKLSHIIKSSQDITETRADLHQWMGEVTGDRSFLDRARTILIDQQINRVRNEIDDNRIYVDVARFVEWINDELIRELNLVLTSMEHKKSLGDFEDVQIINLIERCYSEFCGNNMFGIASYLGRRIRHGTFKGHLYSGVVAIELQYPTLFNDVGLSARWEIWKKEYEKVVDEIIRNRLHVESSSKRYGLLKPHLKESRKYEVAISCSQDLIKDFSKNKSSVNSPQLLTEYCWRLAELDLKNVNSFLKSQKAVLVKTQFSTDFKHNSPPKLQELARDFTRDLQRTIDEKLIAMHGWFKRPISVAPKASLSLLYKAVVAEVKESFPSFEADTSFDSDEDIELVGGAYHVLYDAFYVVVYNAAKHGSFRGNVERSFSLLSEEDGHVKAAVLTITSEISPEQDEQYVNDRLKVNPEDDIENAQLSEDRSGIKKLYHLQTADASFNIQEIVCRNRKVVVTMSYDLVH